MSSTARWVRYKDWSGIAISGSVEFVRPLTENHMERAVWLTSRLEAPRWGSVQSYDGAGMSGGLLHNIAVLPRDLSQGSLFPLVRAIMDDGGTAHCGALRELTEALAVEGWHIAVDGKLRDRNGALVGGRQIRRTFTPVDGVVPRSGPAYKVAVRWAQLFHNLLSSQLTFRAQSLYAIRWLVSGNKQDELSVYRAWTTPQLDSMIEVSSSALPAEVDLAMCVYHSFSVNGPAPAATALRAALPHVQNPTRFASTLIRRIGTSSYGRWHDDPKDKQSRYDTTRLHVWRSGYWESTLARQLMPKDL